MVTTPLGPWLDRREDLIPFVDLNMSPDLELGGFLGIEACFPAHEANNIARSSLKASWKVTQDYVNSALELISADTPPLLDREEVHMILEELGNPPEACCPVYLISVGSGNAERVVYVGKSSSSINRFGGGHSALVKLLHPKYGYLRKSIYKCCVMLLTKDKGYLPLEWVKPLAAAEQMLLSVEAQLIHELKPELNVHHKNNYTSKNPMYLHIQNFVRGSKLLNERHIFPLR